MASALSMIAAAGRAQRNQVVAIVVVFVVMMVGEYSYSRFLAWQDVWKAAQRASVPASHWFDFRSLTIPDTPYGKDPQITSVDRTIIFEKRHTAHWEAVVYHRFDNGDTKLLCTGRGSSPGYHKDSKVPVPVGLVNWWLFRRYPETECEVWPFPVGKTCLYTKWTFTPMEGPFPGTYKPRVTELNDYCWQTISRRTLQ